MQDLPGETARGIATLSIDLDPIAHYLRARNLVPNPETRLNAVYDDALPRFLALLKEFEIKATFFAVGEDLSRASNRELLARAAAAGHEIANHTMNHHTNFFLLSADETLTEIANAEKLIAEVTGKKVAGFRAPGWNISPKALKILDERGYLYDSSVLGSVLNKLMKFYMHVRSPSGFHSDLDAVRDLKKAPRVPYRPDMEEFWKVGNLRLLELPPSVSRRFRLPFHASFMFLPLGKFYVERCLRAHARSGLPLIYEFHGLDLVDPAQVNDSRLRVKEGFPWKVEKKIHRMRFLLNLIKVNYREILTLEELAKAWLPRLTS